MNIIDIQDQLKNFSEDQLINEMQMPSGSAPQFLVLSEIQRRKRMRDDFAKREAAMQPTVAQEALAAAGVPQEGIAGMSEAMAPKAAMAQGGVGSVMSQPAKMASGGLAMLGREIHSGLQEDIEPFLDEVEGMAESRFGIELPEMANRPQMNRNMPPIAGIGQFMQNRQSPFSRPIRQDRTTFEQAQAGMSGKGGAPSSLQIDPAPSPVQKAIPFDEGGLVAGLFANTDRGKELSSKDYEIRIGKDGRQMVYKKGTNIFMGTADKLFDSKYDGGVLRAQKGAFFGGMSEEDIDLNDILDAIQSYESQRSRTAFGSPPSADAMSAIGGVGERSAYQIRPETLLDFGRGYESYQPIFPEITDRIGEGKDFANAFEAYKDPNVKSQVDEYLADPDNARDAAMGILSSAYTETGDIDKAIMAYNAGLPGVLKGSEAGLPYLKGVKGQFDEMSERRQFILGGITSAMGPMAIRGLGEQYYGKGDPVIDAALEERGYNPSGMAVVTTEPATATKDVTTPTGDVIEAGETIPEGTTLSQSEAAANAIPADATGGSIGNEPVVEAGKVTQTASVDTSEEPEGTDDGDDAPDTEPDAPEQKPESNVTFQQPAATPASSIESEILKLQQQMQKNRESDKWLAIAQAGLALMSSDNPTLLGAAGEAGIEGLKAFREANDRYQEGVVDLINARAKLVKDGKVKGLTSSSAVSRLNKIEELLNPTDPAALPLSDERRQALEEERRYLMREILNYPQITA